MEPQYFGPPEARLFACCHPASGAAEQRRGVLLCNPIGHEYMACYRAMRQMAARIAATGAAAFRFDFYGCGDSAGDASAGHPTRWIEDIDAAASEMGKRYGDPVALAGWRLGATLALLSLQRAKEAEPRALVLWDPIVDGTSYVAELTALQRERFGRSDTEEILGFPFTTRLCSELEKIDLRRIERAPARVLVVETGGASQDTAALTSRLAALGANVERRVVAGPGIWHTPNKASVPAGVVQSIASWLRNGWS